MKKNKNISKSIILRLAILLMLFAGAMTFDMCHDRLPSQVNPVEKSTSKHSLNGEQVFLFNTTSGFKLIDKGNRLLTRVLRYASEDKFLAQFHNHRAFHTLKEDSVKDRLPLHLMAHFIRFTQVAYSSPDDYPPSL